MITIDQYFGPFKNHPDATMERWRNAVNLLERVNPLLERAEDAGVHVKVNPETGSQVSGTQYGGFRPQSCAIGAPSSAHKQGRAVDVYDPGDHLDAYLNDTMLEAHGLYREDPSATKSWVHLTDRPPPSGRRTFHP